MSDLSYCGAYQDGQLDLMTALWGAVREEPWTAAVSDPTRQDFAMWCLGHCLVTAAACELAASRDYLVAAHEAEWVFDG